MESNNIDQQAPTNSSDREVSEINTAASHSQHEDRLARTWRHLISSVFNATAKAEQIATSTDVASVKEIDEAVVAFLRARLEWGRNISFLEAKLEGKAKEMEVLQHFVRTQPCLGTRKRKRRPSSQEKSPTAKISQIVEDPQESLGSDQGTGHQPSQT